VSEALPIASRRLHIATILFRALATLRSFAIPILAALYASRSLDLATWIGGGVGLAMLLPSTLSWWRFRYAVDGESMMIESGVLSRNRRVIPFARVADVDIERGPLQRLFGLATVRIETGGSDKDEGLLDSVSLAEAERLRETVRRARQVRVSALNAGAAAEKPLFEMTTGDLLRFGLFSFSFASLSLIVAAIGGIVSQVDGLRDDMVDLVKDVAERNVASGIGSATIVALIFALVAAALITSIARVFIAEAGYRLTETAHGFRRVRGLFTKREVLIPRARVQLATLASGPVWRAVDRYGLSVQTLSGADGAGGNQPMAPFARHTEIIALIAKLPGLRLPGDLPLIAVSPLHALARATTMALLAALPVVIAGFFELGALFGLGLVPLLAAWRWLEARGHRYALVDHLLWVQRGFRRRTLAIVPASSVQVVTVSRSWRERQFGLATLSVDTAGGLIEVQDLPFAEAARLARALLDYSGRKSGTDR
jgi:putative membrane protein